MKFINREISWLSFNERVLQEAQDKSVPLLERFRFLGIFSSNMDEFFRVRVATISRMVKDRYKEDEFGNNPQEILKEIDNLVKARKTQFDECFDYLINELKKEKIYLLNEKELDKNQKQFVSEYFIQHVRNTIFPIILNNVKDLPLLNDQSFYLAVVLQQNSKSKYALIEIQNADLPRFVEIPSSVGKKAFIFIDDIIRFNLPFIFKQFDFKEIEAYTIKITRDSELEIDTDVSRSLLQLLERSIKNRKKGDYVRFIYDDAMPKTAVDYFIKKLKINKSSAIISGARYHNLRDLQQMPDFGRYDLLFPKIESIAHPKFDLRKSMLQSIKLQDALLMFPYHSFTHFIDFLYEASLASEVNHIYITAYRLARNSKVVAALLNAARNGKKVTILIEPQARFDEASNIRWAQYLQEEGIEVIVGVKGLKVHSKVCLIECTENKKNTTYAYIGTGNFNEKTAGIYSDFGLFTYNQKIGKEIKSLFNFFHKNFDIPTFQHLVVSPFNLRRQLTSYIKNEIKQAEKGKRAEILLKMNSLVDLQIANLLVQAGNAGVKVKLIVRGMSIIATDIHYKNVEVISIIDRYLEHARVFHFHNGGEPVTFIGSADLMTRNIDYRVEVLTPILDKNIQQKIMDIWNIQWNDNIKARWQSAALLNNYVTRPSASEHRSQMELYHYFKNRKK